MYIRKTTKQYKGKTYENYLLVESYQTPKGPRQKTICSLGNLKARPREEWLQLARRVEKALIGQMPLFGEDAEVNDIVEKVKATKEKEERASAQGEVIPVKTEEVQTQNHREVGPVHVGHKMWERLDLDRILEDAGVSSSGSLLTQAMVMNRLIAPSSEHSMPDWIRRTALADILDVDFGKLNDDALYRNMDKLYPSRGHIEKGLASKEESLFGLDTTLYFYDLTSTYFEGNCLGNPQAKRGYSRDKRPDCKQVVIGLVLDREGFPKAHEIFDGNTNDSTTIEEMLDTLERRVGKKEGAAVIVDRGMAYDNNIKQIKDRGYHYIVAAKPYELNQWLDEFEAEADWQEIIRTPSPLNPYQKKTKLLVKSREKDDEVYLLCISDGRKEKDKAIRQNQERKLIKDIGKLKSRIEKGRLKKESKIHQAIGRIKERYPRVARYYDIDFDNETNALLFNEVPDKKKLAEKLDGSYIIKTDRKNMTDEEIWRTYILLTRVENAFRNIKSPLCERPIFHQLKNRVQTHIFLCLLAYHLLICIEKTFLDKGIHTSWESIKEKLSTHQVATVVLPTDKGRVLYIRKGSTPENEHKEIYDTLEISYEVMKPKRIWSGEESSDGKNEKAL
jgi:transposase